MVTPNSMRSSKKPAPPNDGQLHDAPGLEFPDWSGMASRDARMTFEQAVLWNEEMLSTFPPKPNRAALDSEVRCNVEFRLL